MEIYGEFDSNLINNKGCDDQPLLFIKTCINVLHAGIAPAVVI
ncbi:hypothetical protein SAMN05443550_11135 [Pedobacter hartonius]|uniref:Uncharacterized protein n=1 Tax=Pedobacter hartonius TaxID=425514 RepID=A0A1H4GSK4_9SPHI|nr:hypothetical protein SAMN05443550_11135 [Pedobacter hartonius]